MPRGILGKAFSSKQLQRKLFNKQCHDTGSIFATCTCPSLEQVAPQEKHFFAAGRKSTPRWYTLCTSSCSNLRNYPVVERPYIISDTNDPKHVRHLTNSSIAHCQPHKEDSRHILSVLFTRTVRRPSTFYRCLACRSLSWQLKLVLSCCCRRYASCAAF